jgi:hypothetical protein
MGQLCAREAFEAGLMMDGYCTIVAELRRILWDGMCLVACIELSGVLLHFAPASVLPG